MPGNPDPFGLQFGLMAPVGSVTSRIDNPVPPPLPPRRRTEPGQDYLQKPAASPTSTRPNFNVPTGLSSNPPDQHASDGIHSPTAHFSLRSLLSKATKKASHGIARTVSSPMDNVQVVVNGVQLGRGDIANLWAQLGSVSSGAYWYDRRSGAYGLIGGPCIGAMMPGQHLGGGQLAPNSSGNSGTGVFINGREIHALDVMGLRNIGVSVMQGNWWVNGDGSYGAIGSPIVIGNLRMQAQRSGTTGSQSWNTGQGNYGGSDGQGFWYVGGSGWNVSGGG
ncbi:hypothetical protein PT974_04379 [Cladobotryum mycophilum]|uniref:Uncharacterized protein n=1 Tax=Cladobotryum mycophilum TaxID=491253 RepID=A0ABR0SVC8_9HYPO